jgi:iron complex outermembrane receptor protein
LGSLTKDSQTNGKVLLVLLIFLFLPPQAWANKLIYFDISAKRADQGLIEFAEHIDQTIIYSFDLTKNHQTSEVKGYYSAEFALSKLLSRSGLTAHRNENNVFAISLLQNQLIAPPQKTIITAPNNNVVAISPTIEKISIVGSRTARRSLTDLPVPVDILHVNNLTQTGQTSVGRMLQTLAPSFNFSRSSISDGSDVLQPATLRGLGPDQTLVLVNGKRRHQASLIHINNSVGRGTAGTDLNALPIAAIKRIEILRDGAAAQYGSDAIAGVINIVLNDDNSTNQANISYGEYSQGDGAVANIEASKSFTINEQGFISFTASFSEHNATDRSGSHGACQFSGCIEVAKNKFLTSNPREINATRDTFDIGDPAYQQHAFVANTGYTTDTGEFYGFATYSVRDNTSAAFFRTNNNAQANPKLQDFEAIIPEGYLPKIESQIRDYSLNLGYIHEFNNGTSIDTSYTYGKNTIDYRTTNSINASYVNLLRFQENFNDKQIRSSIQREADAYGLSLSLQTLNLDIHHDLSWATLAMGFEFRRDEYQIIAGEQYSYFDYDNVNSSPLLAHDSIRGIQGFPGISPSNTVNEQRHVRSFYVELDQQISTNVTINNALRFDHYDGFGNSTNYKLSANWIAKNWLTLRAAISTGFRAPSMQQLYFNNSSTQFIVNSEEQLEATQIGTFRNDSAIAKTIGVPDLKEEKSLNLSAGAILNINENTSFTFDFYAIDIDDRIVISNSLGMGLLAELDQALSDNNVDKAQVFLNGANTQTRGLDIIATWQDEVLEGHLDLTLSANFTDTEVKNLYTPKKNGVNTLSVEQVFSQHDIAIIEDWQPESRISAILNYQKHKWLTTLSFNHFGQYSVLDGQRQTYGAKLLTDIRVKFQLTPTTALYFGSNNVFDVYPDKNTIGNSNEGTIIDNNGNTVVSSNGVFKYSRRSAPFGFNGSYFYFGLNHTF